MITSPHNEKLKLIRRLGRRRTREREGLFVGEGEDMLAAAREAGAEPLELLTAAGEGLGGTEVEPALLDRFSSLASGTRAIGVWREAWSERAEPPCVYLHGVSDPGNVGTVIRTANALVGGSVVLGPGCADPYGPHAVRASMGAVFAQPLLRGGVEGTPEPRAALVAHGGESLEALAGVATICLGAERDGLPEETVEGSRVRVTIQLRDGAESLNVAAAAAIALHRIASDVGEGHGD
ncbi:MAG TPA: RNA methyltransferase [Solirubrobacterales bacterium]|nr:RNA methyltransferase [Solirubrobacterales bacterium]